MLFKLFVRSTLLPNSDAVGVRFGVGENIGILFNNGCGNDTDDDNGDGKEAKVDNSCLINSFIYAGL